MSISHSKTQKKSNIFLASNVSPSGSPNLQTDSKEKLESLKKILKSLGEVIVAYSGGVDSSLLAKAANDVLGKKALIATAVSPSLASGEREHCREFAKNWGLNWVEVETNEIDLQKYRDNQLDRCYWCKVSLMDGLEGLRTNSEAIVLGVNLDDLADYRPGIDAAKERGAKFPFLEAKISKQNIRDISQEMGLETWDKPAEPCLASRIPFGTEVSVGILSQIDEAESKLKKLGFLHLRVRHFGDTARIEVPEEDFLRIVENRKNILSAVQSAGYKFVTLDLSGLRTGGLVPDFLKINTKS